MALPCPPIMETIGGIWSDTAIAGYMGFATICGGKAEPLPLRVGIENTNSTYRARQSRCPYGSELKMPIACKGQGRAIAPNGDVCYLQLFKNKACRVGVPRGVPLFSFIRK
jgi:hypothetical protein